jgi:uncharacterized protein with ATP-grasp and redox domains
MPVFSLLAQREQYHPCNGDDLRHDEPLRTYWINFFAHHFDFIVALAQTHYGPTRLNDITSCRAEFLRTLDALRKDPNCYGELNLIVLDLLRQQKLLQFRIPDPFLTVKQRENAAALQRLPALLAELDGHRDLSELFLLLIEGVFAGNIFDLGAHATAETYAHTTPDFLTIRTEQGGRRPWLVDHYDALAQRVTGNHPPRKVVMFLDNAGSDVVLGMIPLARFFAQRGAEVILTANRLPALNDITHRELLPLVQQVGQLDRFWNDALKRGQIRIIESGGVAPLIDLRHVSPVLNTAVSGADFLVLEGMGRSLESNFNARFTVDSMKICLIKDQMVAQRMGGKVFDQVLRYDPALLPTAPQDAPA